MRELLTAAQMRAIEQAAIDSGEVSGLELMERAGRGVVQAVFAQWPDLANTSQRAVVLCGPGNNGGDGFVVARLLQEWGWDVGVFLYGDSDRLPPDARVNYERWAALGETIELNFPELGDTDVSRFEQAVFLNSGTSLLVDALFGTGLARPVSGLAEILAMHDRYRAMAEPPPIRTVAVDMPSGLCSDSGNALGLDGRLPFVAMRADLTVSFHAEKLGHRLGAGPSLCGRVGVVDIGLAKSPAGGRQSREGASPLSGTVAGRPVVPARDIVRLIEPKSLPELGKLEQTHKYTHGHALVIAGGAGRTGAARLAARGALRIGAGLVTLGVAGSAQQEVAVQITALMLRRIEDAAGLAAVLEDARLNALCLGPGLGVERARELVPVALDTGRQTAGSAPAVVLDADAITAFADRPEALFGLLHPACVLTPHAGEFARLFPDIAERLNQIPTRGPAFSRVDATREAARRAGCVVLFKGPDTVIAHPDGRCSVNSASYHRAAPWLATAGSGDALAGFIAGLLARGFDPMRAAETASWLHVECALDFGPGLIAEDLPETLPTMFRRLGL